jgi:hypothetical protein
VGNATLDDLLAALSANSSRDRAEWSKAWLETAGPNTLRGQFAVDTDGRFTAFAVPQEAPAEPHAAAASHRGRTTSTCCARRWVTTCSRTPLPGGSRSDASRSSWHSQTWIPSLGRAVIEGRDVVQKALRSRALPD